MVSSPSFRSRRFASRKVVPTQQVLVFCLRQVWFALPIQVISKVIRLETLHRVGSASVIGLVLYHNQEIPVLDIYQRIFGQPLAEEPLTYLVIVQNPQGELLGFPLETQPRLQRVPNSAFSALSTTYQIESTMRCTQSLIIRGETEPPIFFLTFQQLLEMPAN